MREGEQLTSAALEQLRQLRTSGCSEQIVKYVPPIGTGCGCADDRFRKTGLCSALIHTLAEYTAVRTGGGRSDADTITTSATAPHWLQCIDNVYSHTTYTLQPVRAGGGGETLFYKHIFQPGAVIT